MVEEGEAHSNMEAHSNREEEVEEGEAHSNMEAHSNREEEVEEGAHSKAEADSRVGEEQGRVSQNI